MSEQNGKTYATLEDAQARQEEVLKAKPVPGRVRVVSTDDGKYQVLDRDHNDHLVERAV